MHDIRGNTLQIRGKCARELGQPAIGQPELIPSARVQEGLALPVPQAHQRRRSVAADRGWRA